MKIRKAKIEDAEAVANVLMNSYNIKSVEEGIAVFKNEINKGSNYIVAVDNKFNQKINEKLSEKIIGIISWIVKGLPKHELIELDRIAVLPEYKGKGIAIKLFQFLKKDSTNFYKSKGCKLRKVYLCVHAKNLRAQSFYEKIGFKYEAILKNHYYDGVDEMIFSMFLD